MPFRPSVLLLLPLLGLTQCRMQEGDYPVQPMPDATQVGLNTAGCVVDGLPWVAYYYNSSIDAPAVQPAAASWDNRSAGRSHHLSLYFLKNLTDLAQVHNQTTIQLEMPDITQPGTYVLDQPTPPGPGNTPPAHAVFTFRKTNPVQELLTRPGEPGRVVLTRFDTLSNTVSGTFEFTARQAQTGRTVHVTEGRFDCKF